MRHISVPLKGSLLFKAAKVIHQQQNNISVHVLVWCFGNCDFILHTNIDIIYIIYIKNIYICIVLKKEGYNSNTMYSLTKFSLNKIFWIVLSSKNYCMNHTLPDIPLEKIVKILETKPQNNKNAKNGFKK